MQAVCLQRSYLQPESLTGTVLLCMLGEQTCSWMYGGAHLFSSMHKSAHSSWYPLFYIYGTSFLYILDVVACTNESQDLLKITLRILMTLYFFKL